MSKTAPAEAAPRTFSFVSLGCPKNTVDSERMLGLLAKEGYRFVPDPDGADLVVVNTCGFIESSRAESRAVIKEMTDLKDDGRVGGVVVTGCLAERLGPQIITEIPKIDRAVGVFAREEIVKVADEVTGRLAPAGGRVAAGTAALGGAAEQRTIFRPASVKNLQDTARLRATPRHYAYLKVSEGCDRTCTFCAIPKMRGKHMTKPIDDILAEARELVADGVRELILVAQDLTYYGKDLYGRVRLAELLRELDRVEGVEWLRLLYAYPEHVTDELLDTLAGATRIVPYLDMPLQHANSAVLKRMQRRVNREQTEAVLASLRSRWPGVALRTTFIVGFPGETEEQFADLEQFVREQRFERAGVFTYSFEEGTPATRLDGHLPEEVKQERQGRLMLAQQEVAFAHSATKVGREMTVVVDAVEEVADEDGRPVTQLIARTTADAPDIDTLTYVVGDVTLVRPGQFLPVRVVATDEYDLVAEPAGPAW